MNDQRKEEIEAAENYFIGGKRPGRIRISSQLISIDQDNKRGLETFCPRGKAQSAPKGHFTTDVGDSLTRFFPEKGKWKEEKRRRERAKRTRERKRRRRNGLLSSSPLHLGKGLRSSRRRRRSLCGPPRVLANETEGSWTVKRATAQGQKKEEQKRRTPLSPLLPCDLPRLPGGRQKTASGIFLSLFLPPACRQPAGRQIGGATSERTRHSLIQGKRQKEKAIPTSTALKGDWISRPTDRLKSILPGCCVR